MIRALLLALAIFGLPAEAAELQGPFFPGSRGGSGSGSSSAVSPRWLFPFFDYAGGSSQAAGAGRVLGMEFENLAPCTATGIAYEVGGVSSGTVRVGIYGPATTPEEMGATALIAESTDVAQGSINTGQTVSFVTPVALNVSTPSTRALYYAAIEFSSGTATFLRTVITISVTGFLPYYDRAGGYGAMTNPAPTVSHNINAVHPALKVLCQ